MKKKTLFLLILAAVAFGVVKGYISIAIAAIILVASFLLLNNKSASLRYSSDPIGRSYSSYYD